MERLSLHTTDTVSWHVLLNQAQASARCVLDPELESYLVVTLVSHARAQQDRQRIPLLRVGLGPRVPGEELRRTGDHCLVSAGFFPEPRLSGGLAPAELVNLGRDAYRLLGQDGARPLFQALSDEFVNLVDVLQAMRRLERGGPSLEPMDAYDLWRDTGSRQALEVLARYSRGFPVAAQGRLN